MSYGGASVSPTFLAHRHTAQPLDRFDCLPKLSEFLLDLQGSVSLLEFANGEHKWLLTANAKKKKTNTRSNHLPSRSQEDHSFSKGDLDVGQNYTTGGPPVLVMGSI